MGKNITRSSTLNSNLKNHCVRVISLFGELKKVCDLQGTVHLDKDYPLRIAEPGDLCVGPFNVSGGWFQTIIARRKSEIINELFYMGYDLTHYEEPLDEDE